MSHLPEPGDADYPDGLWNYPEPDIQETINLNDQGLSEGGDVGDYIQSYAADNRRLEIEPGTYDLTGGALELSLSDFELRGLGDRGDVVLYADSHTSHNQYAEGGTLVLNNLELRGDNTKLRFGADHGAEMVYKHVISHADDAVAKEQGIWTSSDSSAGPYLDGTGRLLWCHFEGFSDNGAYVDGYWETSGENAISVVGGLYKDSDISALRVGMPETRIYRVTVHQTGNQPVAESDNDNPRGLRVRQPGHVIVDECDITQESAAGHEEPFEFSRDGENGTGELLNTRIHNDGDKDAIGGSADWTTDNVHITGDGNLNSDLSLSNSCVGDGCDVASTDPWWGDDTVSAPSDDMQWKRRYNKYTDNFEIGDIGYPYSDLFSLSNYSSNTGIVAPDGASTRSLSLTGGDGSQAIGADPSNSTLRWMPELGEDFEFWLRQNTISADVEQRFGFYGTNTEDPDSYNAFRLNVTNGNMELGYGANGNPPSETTDGGPNTTSVSMSADTWYRCEITSDSSTGEVTVTLYESDGTELGNVSFTDDRETGAGLFYWLGSSATSSHTVYFDQVYNLDAPEPNDLICNFNSGYSHFNGDFTEELDPDNRDGTESWILDVDNPRESIYAAEYNGNDGIVWSEPGDGLDNYINQGSDHNFHYYLPSGSSDLTVRYLAAYDSTSDNGVVVEFDVDGGSVYLRDYQSGSFITLDSANVNFSTESWESATLKIDANDSIEAQVAGETLTGSGDGDYGSGIAFEGVGADSGARFDRHYYPQGTSEDGTDTIDLYYSGPGGGNLSATASVETGGSISGRAIREGSGFEGAEVIVVNRDTDVVEGVVVTDSGGNFSLDVPPGEYHVSVEAEEEDVKLNAKSKWSINV